MTTICIPAAIPRTKRLYDGKLKTCIQAPYRVDVALLARMMCNSIQRVIKPASSKCLMDVDATDYNHK